MHRLIARDERGALVCIGNFGTEEGARKWWADQYGDGGPWELLGTAYQISGTAAAHEWHSAGRGIALRAQGRPHAPHTADGPEDCIRCDLIRDDIGKPSLRYIGPDMGGFDDLPGAPSEGEV